MEAGITNDIVFFFKRALPNYVDFLTTNIKITNILVNQNSNQYTISTLAAHSLEEGSFVFLNNILYGYSISSIIEENITINFLTEKLVKITFNEKIIANENQIISIKGIDSNPLLNNKFIIYKCLPSKEGNQTTYYGKYEDVTIDTTNINIQNEGGVYLPFVDDIFAIGNAEKSNGFSTTTIGGTFNGLKVVHSIVDEYTFIVKFYENNNILQPEIPLLIDLSEAYIKINNQVFGVADIDNNLLENATTHLLENGIQAAFLISKDSNESSIYGSAISNASINSNFAFESTEEQIIFNCTLLFRVKRQDYGTQDHYILGYESNQITDYFTKVIKSLTNRFFFESNVFLNNKQKSNILYKSYFSGSASINSLNNVENGVFKTCTFEFKITRLESGYDTFNINAFGIPIKEINLNIKFDSIDEKNIKIT